MLKFTKKDMILYNRIRYQIGGRKVIWMLHKKF